MLYKQPSSIRIVKPETHFQIEDENSFIIDPFEIPPIQLLGKRILNENEYFPFLYLKSNCESFHSVLLFASRNADQLVAWKVTHGNPTEYVGQCQLPASNIYLLVTLADAPLAHTRQQIQKSSQDAPEWARIILHSVVNRLSQCTEIEETLSTSNEHAHLSQLVFSHFTRDVNMSTPSLIKFIHHNIASPESEQVIHLFDTFNSRIGNDFDTCFSEIGRYCILRELVCVVTGRHVILDPFTRQHVLSDCTALCSTTHYGAYPFIKSRLIRYKSAFGQYFVERRGPGWLDVTSSIILPNGLFIEVESGHQWGERVTLDEVQWILKLFGSDPLPLHQEDQQLLISEVASGDNIGHVLWNEASGYVEFILTCQEAGWRPKRIVPILPSSTPSRFSKLGVRSALHPYIQKSIRSQASAAEVNDMAINYLASMRQQELSSQLFVKHQIASFRYPRLTKAVVSAIIQDFPPTVYSKVRIYKNIRFHNKAQTNTAECLQELFCQLSAHDNPQIHPSNIELDLEFSERHEGVISKIAIACREHGVHLNLRECYEVTELLQLVSLSCISIVPIGSGAVLPTWVFHKHTILHAEAAHRSQMQWWHLAGNSEPTRQYLIPGDSIHDEPATAGMGYSNYEIEPKAYATTVITALEDYLLSQSQHAGAIA
jgi:hypothetical protein